MIDHDDDFQVPSPSIIKHSRADHALLEVNRRQIIGIPKAKISEENGHEAKGDQINKVPSNITCHCGGNKYYSRVIVNLLYF
jgi:hypothetical protein